MAFFRIPLVMSSPVLLICLCLPLFGLSQEANPNGVANTDEPPGQTPKSILNVLSSPKPETINGGEQVEDTPKKINEVMQLGSTSKKPNVEPEVGQDPPVEYSSGMEDSKVLHEEAGTEEIVSPLPIKSPGEIGVTPKSLNNVTVQAEAPAAGGALNEDGKAPSEVVEPTISTTPSTDDKPVDRPTTISVVEDNVLIGNNEGGESGSKVSPIPSTNVSVTETTVKPEPKVTPAEVTTTTKKTLPAVETVESVVSTTTMRYMTQTERRIEVEISNGAAPYTIVTEKVTTKVPNNGSVLAPSGEVKGDTFFTPKMIGILVGAVVGLILIIIIIAVTIVALRRRRKTKNSNFAVIENPRYLSESGGSGQPHNYRFSRDASLLIGGQNLSQSALANNNLNDKNDMHSERKKRRAPAPPNPFTGQHDFPLRQDSNDYYEKLSVRKKNKAPPPPNPFTGEVDSLSNPNAIQYFEKFAKKKKRRAPAPPNPFTGVLDETFSQTLNSEKDSPTGSEIELSTFTSGFKKDRVAHDDTPEADRVTPQASHSGPEAEEGEQQEPESQALLSDIERETGYNLSNPPPKPARQSLADKYEFSDDEDARESRDYYRQESVDNFSSDDDLDNSRDPTYDVSDIQDELQKSDDQDKTTNPFES